MNRILEIALDVFWLVVIIGGGGWLFLRTLRNSEEPTKNAFKIIFSTIMVVGEVFFVRSMIGHLSEDRGMGNAPFALVMTGSIVICSIIMSILWTRSEEHTS